jgi:hypothetical protein
MLSHSVLSYDGLGNIRNNSAGIPTHFVAGIPFIGVLLVAASAGIITAYHDGLPYDSAGRLLAATGGIDHYSQGGIGLLANNFIAIVNSAAPVSWNSGLPVNANSKLIFAPAEVFP